jgi:hypothetical protein
MKIAYTRGVPNFTRVYDCQNTPSSHTGDTAETVLYTLTIPGGTMGPNGILTIDGVLTVTNNANNKNFRLKFGSTEYLTTATSMANTRSAWFSKIIANQNDQAVQVGSLLTIDKGPGSKGTLNNVTGTENTASDIILQLTVELEAAGDTATLDFICVNLMKP